MVNDRPESKQQAIIFYIISVIVSIVVAPKFFEHDIDWTYILELLIGFALAVFVYAGVIYYTWLVFRKSIRFKLVALASLYIMGVHELITTLFSSISVHYLMSEDMSLAKEFYGGVANRILMGSASSNVDINDFSTLARMGHNSFGILSYLASIVWLLATWGVYRHWNGSSRWFSGVVFIIVYLVMGFISAMFLPIALGSFKQQLI